MTPEISTALVLPAPPDLRSLPLRRPTAASGVSALTTAIMPSANGAVAVARDGREHGFRRVISALGDIVGLLAVAYAFPLVILAIGIPIALLVRLVMWIVGAG